MPDNHPKVRVHVNIEISAAALQAVVANSKKLAGKDENGRYAVDTADALASLISRFLEEQNFNDFAGEISNYD